MRKKAKRDKQNPARPDRFSFLSLMLEPCGLLLFVVCVTGKGHVNAADSRELEGA